MSKNLELKQQIVSEVKEKLEKSSAVLLVDYKGINVADVTELRKRFREAGVDYKVYKNTLFKRAAQELGIEELNEFLEGTVGYVFGYDDVVSPARTINQFQKDYPKTPLTVKAGYIEKGFMDAKAVKALGDLPSREVLIAMLLGALQGSVRNLAYMLNSIKEKKEAEA
ncbi:MAG: 50S ribosomal protein L10 [Lutispora sp.]|jgi:large subunit ribosomal protein L10|uniref:50S ribosomal protein L10 n=1 Tax=Lutispora sp. TaxID=2828727 RepID=UPI003564385E